MQLVEIIVIIIAISLVLLPVILHFKNRNKKCTTSCSSCSKACVAKMIKEVKIKLD